MNGVAADAATVLPTELRACHAPELKTTFQRRRIPFLVITVAAMVYAAVSTMFMSIEMRLAGIAGFTVLLIGTFMLYNKHWNAYEQWKHLDIIRLMESSGGDLELEMEFFTVFRDEGKDILKDIQESALKADYKALGDHAHKLKGSALTVGFPEIARTSLRIETLCGQNLGLKATHLIPRLQGQMQYIETLMQRYFAIRSNALNLESKKDR